MSTRHEGFTLLELLAVMAIIGILASIAIPQFSEYRKRAFDTRALSDLRNAATAEEVYFMDNEIYLTCRNSKCEELPGMNRLSKGVSLEVTAAADSTYFTAIASHKQGSKELRWDTREGGLLDN